MGFFWMRTLADLTPVQGFLVGMVVFLSLSRFVRPLAWRRDPFGGLFSARTVAGVVVFGLGGFMLVQILKTPPGASAEETVKGGERVIHFPTGRSLGRILVQDADVDDSLDPFGDVVFNWRYVGEAMGDVAVLADKRVGLWVHESAFFDLSPLSGLRPDDLYMLLINPYPGPKVNPDQAIMPHLRGLAGLKTLVLDYMNVTEKGLRFLKELKALKYLRLSSEPAVKPGAVSRAFGEDAGMTCLAGLESLETLWLSDPSISDDGLAYLARLKSLKELQLWSASIRGPGLAHLSKIPSLRWLRLQLRLGDAGVSYLKNAASLRELSVTNFGITDAALVHLANLTELEDLDLSQNVITDKGLACLNPMRSLMNLNLSGTNITDNGLLHLKAMPSLRSLDLANTRITDDGLAHLREGESLERLKLPGGISDKGLAHVGELSKLTFLSLSDPGRITDAGLKHLAGLRSLKELHLRGEGVADEGMSCIAGLVNLQTLELHGCPITNTGLAKLSTLKSLKKLTLRRVAVTISGLAHLNAMADLTRLELYNAPQDGTALDIGGLSQLEFLDFGKTQLHDEDLACLAKLTRLRELYVFTQRGVSDAGIAHLAGLTSLEHLGIGGPNLTNRSLSYLANMKKLDYLWIGDGDFTDGGLRHLEGLRGLRRLEITSKNAFSREALDRLRKKLPNLQVLKIVP